MIKLPKGKKAKEPRFWSQMGRYNNQGKPSKDSKVMIKTNLHLPELNQQPSSMNSTMTKRAVDL